MPGASEDVIFKLGGTTFAALEAKSFKRSATAISWTDSSSKGRQTFVPGKVSADALEISVSGFHKDDHRLAAIGVGPAADLFLDDASLEFPGWGVISGKFFMNDYSGDAPLGDAVKFSATLMSDGDWTFTAAGAS